MKPLARHVARHQTGRRASPKAVGFDLMSAGTQPITCRMAKLIALVEGR